MDYKIETYEFEDSPLQVEVRERVEVHEGSTGPGWLQNDPDTSDTMLQIKSVTLYGIELTRKFDCETWFNKDDGTIEQHLEEIFLEILQGA